VANTLRQLGVRRGDAVALLAPNCAQLIPAMLAAQLAGIAAPLNAALSPEHLRQLLRRSAARVLLAAGPELDPDAWEKARALAAGGWFDAVLVLRPTGAAGPAAALPRIAGTFVEYLSVASEAQDAAAFEGTPPGPGQLAAFFHTGGTTGAPKLAAHTHANEVANAWMLADNEVFDEDSVLFAGLPLFHVNALIVTLLTPLFKGQRVVWAGPMGYREPALYAEFWRIVEVGVLVISGPTVFAGYVSARGVGGHHLDAGGKLVDGWLDTGDLGFVDAQGFVYLRGRAKDLIIRGGHNIDPAIIEDALLTHPQVVGAAAVGRPDPHAGEVPVAYVVLAPGSEVVGEELRAWAYAHVAERAAAPKTVTVLDALPLTVIGKPYKAGLRADAARTELRGALADVAGVREVQTSIEDGSVAACVVLGADGDKAAAEAVLSRYALGWRVEVEP
jgi:acyl-CoA synthetase (AMP-forming)/AMP-acid ligase II